MEQVVSLELRNNLEESEIIITTVEKYWNDNNLNHHTLFNINLAVEEVFSNIVRYAFTDKNQHFIFFNAYRDKDLFRIEFIDDGRKFNPTVQEKPDVNASIDEREPGGLGIFLVKNFSENVNYIREEGKNKLFITFNLKNGAH
ncbi:MAG: ATP-binding protein [Ignavibacteriaceae bacterium]